MVTVREVKSSRDIREFVELPLRMYKGCPWFVPALYGDEKRILKSGGNNDEVESIFLLAERDGKTVGRIQGIVEKKYDKRRDSAQARFSRFDSIDDEKVARALFDAVEKWAAGKGMTELCGPLGFNDLDREGLLIEGFEEESTFEEQ